MKDVSIKLGKLKEKFKSIDIENEKLHKLNLNKNDEIETILAQSKEYKMIIDKFITEKLDKTTAKILSFKRKFENYSSDYHSSLENLHKFKKMKIKLLKKFNVEKIISAQSHISHCLGFEKYSSIYNEINDKLDKLIEEFSWENKYIYGVNRGQNVTNLWEYDIETHNKCFTGIGTPIPLLYTCIAKLPKNELFCYGNYKPTTGTACIIDLKTKNLKETLPDGTPGHVSGAVYHNNCVYVFGSSNGSTHQTLAKKFDLEEKRWKDEKICVH